MSERPGFSFLICPDMMLLRGQMEKMLAPYGDFERHVYWGDEEPPPKFWESLALEGLFGNPQVIVARQAQNWPAPVWKKISKVLGRGQSLAWPIFCLETAFDKGKPKLPAHIAKLRCLSFAGEKGWVWRNEGLTERNLPSHIQQRAKELGLTFDRDAFALLCTTLPPNAAAVENELARLALMAADGKVNNEMARLSGYGPDCNIFAVIRHLEAGDLAKALGEAARSRDAESLLFPLMAMLARDLRKLWQCRAGEDPHFHYSEAAAKKTLAKKLGFTGLSMAFGILCDTEWQIKTGRLPVAQALDCLLIELARLFGGQARIC